MAQTLILPTIIEYTKEQYENMPQHLRIIMKTAVWKNEEYLYEKMKLQATNETFYVCEKGSPWSRPGEHLYLRFRDGKWTAFDSCILQYNSDVIIIDLLQARFQCDGEDITIPGWHTWSTNITNDSGSLPDWKGTLLCDTRLGLNDFSDTQHDLF